MCILLDSFVTLFLGIIKGIGKQAQATVAYLICFYLISIPASYYFCFTQRYGLRGLYYGLISGLVILIFSLALIVKQANLNAIASQAREKYLKESLYMLRSPELVNLQDLGYTKGLLVNHFNSSSSDAGGEDEEDRSTASISD